MSLLLSVADAALAIAAVALRSVLARVAFSLVWGSDEFCMLRSVQHLPLGMHMYVCAQLQSFRFNMNVAYNYL